MTTETKKPDYTRVKLFALSELAILSTFTTGNDLHVRVKTGFPSDAKILRVRYEREMQTFVMLVYSESFEPLKVKLGVPYGTIEVEKLQDVAGDSLRHLANFVGNPCLEAEGADSLEMALVRFVEQKLSEVKSENSGGENVEG